jgi:hypothetical protein
MPPDPVLLNALRNAKPEQIKQALHGAMDAMVDAPAHDFLEAERLLREHLGLAEALRLLEVEGGAAPPAAKQSASKGKRQRR